MLECLVPTPKDICDLGGSFDRPESVRLACSDNEARHALDTLSDELPSICRISVSENSDYVIELSTSSEIGHREGYVLTLEGKGAHLVGNDCAGLFYAVQTLLQIMALGDGPIPCVRILDYPHYRTRSVMLDIGRAPYSTALIRRVIRIMSRLKLNSLHLHLFDNQLNGVRFNSLPLGSENPAALGIGEYGEIIKYARLYHVSVVPEFECWGHAGSVLYHYPRLYGATGMWEGFSFGIGEELYVLLAQMIDEFMPVMEREGVFHVGLDEAIWALLPSVSEEDAGKYSPSAHVARLYRTVQEAAQKHGKKITMRLWADHGGRPIPEDIRDRVIVEPWMYFEGREEAIREKVAGLSGEGKPLFMMGGGMSQLHFDGHYGATRIWCGEAIESPNCEGVNICVWESNDISGKLIGIYGGAEYAWSPTRKEYEPTDIHGEWARGLMQRKMRKWQAAFPDADPRMIDLDRGPEVFDGKYCWPPLAGIPVAPTAMLIDPRTVDPFHEDRAT